MSGSFRFIWFLLFVQTVRKHDLLSRHDANPGPDPEERLRRLVTLMIKYATGNGQAEPEGDNASHEDDHAEGDG